MDCFRGLFGLNQVVTLVSKKLTRQSNGGEFIIFPIFAPSKCLWPSLLTHSGKGLEGEGVVIGIVVKV